MYNITMTILLGFVAGTLTTFSLLPQIIRILKTKKTKDISLITYSVLATGVFLWFVYGLLIQDTAVILANFITLLFTLSIIYLKMRHG